MTIFRAHLRALFLGIAVLVSLFSLININHLPEDINNKNIKKILENQRTYLNFENNTFPTALGIADLKMKLIQKKIERLSFKIRNHDERKLTSETLLEPNYNVHIFYYSWYRSPLVDNKLKYWNQESKVDNDTYIVEPPMTNYFPQLGFYSSRNSTIVDIHMKQLRRIGIGVILLTWFPAEIEDSPEDNLSLLMDTAAKYNLQIALHIKSYSDRNPINLSKHIKQFIDKFQHHKALYKFPKNNLLLPVYYIYDSQEINSDSWREILSIEGRSSIRGTSYDGIFIGLLADLDHRFEIKKSNFDGFYTYFASNGITYGASWKNWKSLSNFANQNHLIFVPCISPGYSEGIPSSHTRHRFNGNYFDVGWRSAIAVSSPIVGITSFNAWHEGSQIEPAIPRAIKDFRYLDYEPEQPQFYLDLTAWWISRIKR